MEINELIGQLLLRHNCVVIPSFGGFVATRRPAQINYDKGVILPPHKKLTFNKHLDNNDGLLISSWANENNLSFKSAELDISNFAKKSQEKLRTGQRLVIENVGTLFLNEEGNISFEQDRFFNLLLESYGMGEVKFVAEKEISTKPAPQPKSHLKAVPLETNTPQPKEDKEEYKVVEKSPITKGKEVSINTASEKSKGRDPRKFGYKKALKYVAAAAFAPILFYSLWIPATSDVLKSGVIYSNDFNPFDKTPSSTYVRSQDFTLEKRVFEFNDEIARVKKNLPSDVKVFHYPLTEDKYIPVWRDGSSKLSKESSDKNTNSDLLNKKFHLIAGCFSNKSNAESIVEELNSLGINAFILDYHKGLHRVSAQQTDNKRAIKQFQSELKNKGFDSWVLRR